MLWTLFYFKTIFRMQMPNNIIVSSFVFIPSFPFFRSEILTSTVIHFYCPWLRFCTCKFFHNFFFTSETKLWFDDNGSVFTLLVTVSHLLAVERSKWSCWTCSVTEADTLKSFYQFSKITLVRQTNLDKLCRQSVWYGSDILVKETMWCLEKDACF